MKMMTFLAMGAMMLSLSAPAMAMGNKPSAPDAGSSGGGGGSFSSTANDLGNNDGVQQAAGDLGAAIAKGGQALNDQAYQFGNQNPNIPYDKVKSMAQTGTNVYAGGKTLEYAGKAAPHVGWVATSAGYAAEGQYKGATVQAVNGVTRTVTVAKVGSAVATAGGVWATGKLGAVAGSWAGPLGAATGFVLGVGAAYLGGKIWDATVGQGADALTQKAADYDAQSQYGGTGTPGDDQPITTGGGGASWGEGTPGDDMPITTGVASDTRDIGRDNAQQQVRDSIRTSRPSGGSGGGGGCGGPCGR